MLEPQLENNGALSHALAPIYNVYIYIYIYTVYEIKCENWIEILVTLSFGLSGSVSKKISRIASRPVLAA